MRVPINISTTFVLHRVWLHNYVTPSGASVPIPHLDVPVSQKGVGLSSSFSQKVYHDGQGIVLSDHDIGFLIPHVALPLHPLLLVYTLGSSCKTMFSSSTVHIEGKTVACAWFALLPMVVCGQPLNFPRAWPVNFGSVMVGFTGADLFRGLFVYLHGLLFDHMFKTMAKGSTPRRWTWVRRLRKTHVMRVAKTQAPSLRKAQIAVMDAFEKQVAGMLFGGDSLSAAGVMRGLAKAALTANVTTAAETLEYGEGHGKFTAGKMQLKWTLSYSQSKGVSGALPFKADKLFKSDDAKGASTKASRENLTPNGASGEHGR
jgi:hypothetical protein